MPCLQLYNQGLYSITFTSVGFWGIWFNMKRKKIQEWHICKVPDEETFLVPFVIHLGSKVMWSYVRSFSLIFSTAELHFYFSGRGCGTFWCSVMLLWCEQRFTGALTKTVFSVRRNSENHFMAERRAQTEAATGSVAHAVILLRRHDVSKTCSEHHHHHRLRHLPETEPQPAWRRCGCEICCIVNFVSPKMI